MGRKRKKRQPTQSPVPASAAQLTQETEGEMLTQFMGIIFQNLSQSASRRQVPHSMCCMVGCARQKEQQRGSREFLPPCLRLWLAPIHTLSPKSGLALGNTALATARAQLHPQEDVEIFNIRSLAAKVCFTRCFFKGNLFLKPQARNLSPPARDD